MGGLGEEGEGEVEKAITLMLYMRGEIEKAISLTEKLRKYQCMIPNFKYLSA